MLNNDLNTIISNSLIVNKELLTDKIKDIINQFKIVLNNNKNLIEETNKIDKKNNNGFILDFNIINNIFSNIEEENIYYRDVTLSKKDDDKIYGKELFDIGNVVIINDGNPYVIIEMIIKNIKAGNTIIFSNNGYMYGTNMLIITLFQSVLEQFNISKYFVQMYITDNYDILERFANIDLVVCIGDHNLQQLVLKKSKNKTIVSGYENFDLYIEDITHIEFINKILNLGLNIQIFIKSDIDINIENSIKVNDVDEAIAMINYNGNRYSSSIFTNNKDNASKFIKEVKSNIVTVNTSPTIERIIDIKQLDLMKEKIIIYPNIRNI